MLQGSEIVVILLVALVVFGPERLPEMARKLGAWAAELRKAANEVRAGLETEIREARETAEEATRPMKEITQPMREITNPLKDVTQPLKDVTNPLKDVTQPLKDVTKPLKDVTKPLKWVGPIPESGPTPADAMEDFAEIERRRAEAGGSPAESDTGSEAEGERGSDEVDDHRDDTPGAVGEP